MGGTSVNERLMGKFFCCKVSSGRHNFRNVGKMWKEDWLTKRKNLWN